MQENNNVTSKDNNKNEAISNLIQSIQSKLNNENLSSANENNSEDISSCDNDKETNNHNSSNFDLSSIVGLLGKMNNSNNENSGFNFDNLDPKLFNKISQIVMSLGKKDPKKDLLISLKPFLRKSRQDKIGEYITILTIIKAFEAFNDKGSDENE